MKLKHFKTNLSHKHLNNKVFIEIRKPNNALIPKNKYELINNATNSTITYAVLQDKQTIRSIDLDERTCWAAFDCNKKTSLEILDYYYGTKDLFVDVLTFENRGQI